MKLFRFYKVIEISMSIIYYKHVLKVLIKILASDQILMNINTTFVKHKNKKKWLYTTILLTLIHNIGTLRRSFINIYNFLIIREGRWCHLMSVWFLIKEITWNSKQRTFTDCKHLKLYLHTCLNTKSSLLSLHEGWAMGKRNVQTWKRHYLLYWCNLKQFIYATKIFIKLCIGSYLT